MSNSPRGWREAALVVSAALVATILAAWFLQLGPSNFSVPLSFRGDAAFTQAIVKGMAEGGSVYRNPWLGAPGTQVMYDYPTVDALNWFGLWLLVRSTGSAAVAVNAFFLLTFALVAAAGSFTALRARLWPPAAFLVGVLYSLTPYHFYRGQGHLLLSSYWVVPLVVLMALGLMHRVEPPSVADSPHTPGWRRFVSRRVVAVVLLCIAAGTTGLYYAAFSCFLVAVAGAWGWRRYGRRNLGIAAAVVAGVVLVVAVQLIPTLSYHARVGDNAAAVERGAMGGELYGFRLTQMLLPTSGHRSPALAEFKRRYYASLALAGIADHAEGDAAALGLLASLGFLSLLAALVLARSTRVEPGWSSESLISRLSVLNIAAFLLGTAGGVGALLGLALPLLRAYNRVSVVIAFLSLLTVGICITWLASRQSSPVGRITALALCLILLVVGVWDQVPRATDSRSSTVARWTALGDYFAEVEGEMEDGASVFQLPFVPFPENPPVEKMLDYDHFLPYLRSSGVRWSYGAIKGRGDSEWQRRVAKLDTPTMVSELKRNGFDGIWIDRYGYADYGTSVLSALEAALGRDSLDSPDGRYAFFRLESPPQEDNPS